MSRALCAIVKGDGSETFEFTDISSPEATYYHVHLVPYRLSLFWYFFKKVKLESHRKPCNMLRKERGGEGRVTYNI